MGREMIQNSIIDTMETILSLVGHINTQKGIIAQIDIDLLQEHIRKLYQDVHYLDEENRKRKIENQKFRDVQIQDTNNKITAIENEKFLIPHDNERQNNAMTNKDAHLESTLGNIEVQSPELLDEPVDELAINSTALEETNPEDFIHASLQDEKEEHVSVKMEDEIPQKSIVDISEEKKADHKEPALFDETLSVAEKLVKDEKSINDKLSERQQHNAVHQNASMAKLQNLKTAIGINDKFMFVNELFQGDMKHYDAFIREINEMENGFDAQNAYIQKLRSLGVNTESPAALKLGDYIERRFL